MKLITASAALLAGTSSLVAATPFSAPQEEPSTGLMELALSKLHDVMESAYSTTPSGYKPTTLVTTTRKGAEGYAAAPSATTTTSAAANYDRPSPSQPFRHGPHIPSHLTDYPALCRGALCSDSTPTSAAYETPSASVYTTVHTDMYTRTYTNPDVATYTPYLGPDKSVSMLTGTQTMTQVVEVWTEVVGPTAAPEAEYDDGEEGEA